MGAQTSKVARKLPTQARPETIKNIPKESPATIEAVSEVASEIKTEEIQKDGEDPQLLQNLRTLGPVTIAPTVTKMRTSDKMLGIIQERNKVEEKVKNGIKVTENSMSIDDLFSLFEQNKRLNPGEIDQPIVRSEFLKKYSIDEPTLTTLLKSYNTMAVMPHAADEKEERRRGVWVTDKVDWETKVNKIKARNEEIKRAKEEALKDTNKNGENDKDRALKDLFLDHY